METTLAYGIVWARSRDSQPKRAAPKRPSSSTQPPWLAFQSFRDPVLFIAGLAGVAHETLIAVEPRWSLLLIFGAMMALPFPLRADEARRNGGDT